MVVSYVRLYDKSLKLCRSSSLPAFRNPEGHRRYTHGYLEAPDYNIMMCKGRGVGVGKLKIRSPGMNFRATVNMRHSVLAERFCYVEVT